ncbi:MAG: hypothetical protein ACREOF_16540 [Gemmatimonadales bacterium]
MRYLLCAAFALAACGRADTAREDQADTGVIDTTAAAAPAPAPAPGAALATRLQGTWNAAGKDSGSTRTQKFTITWTQAPDGGLTGKIAFRPGETYNVKVVSSSDSRLVYESDPHQSPTLKAEVVTRTEARLSGDSLIGDYEARAATTGKTLRGRFTAKKAAGQ